MLKSSKKKVKTFVKFLRKKLLVEGLSKPYVHSMSDETVLNSFRKCQDCGEVICTKDQQMHVILEFDSPERAFEVLYEEEELHTEEEIEEATVKKINFDLGDLALEDLEEDEVELVDEICSDCFDTIIRHFTEDEDEDEDCPTGHVAIEDAEDEEIVRGKWILEGASSMTQMIDNLENFIEYMKQLRESGFELVYPIEDDYGYLVKQKPKRK